MSKHTKGEWTVEETESVNFGGNIIIRSKNKLICNVYGNKANANLIAAAPEMYEELKITKYLLETLLKIETVDSIKNPIVRRLREIESAIAEAETKK